MPVTATETQDFSAISGKRNALLYLSGFLSET